MRTIFYILLLSTSVSCSKTADVPEISHRISAEFTFSETETWPEKYTIAFGAFSGSSTSPLAYSAVEKVADNTSVRVSLDVPEKADNVRLYLANSAKQEVASFYTYSVEGNTSDLSLSSQRIQLVTFARMQGQIFNACITCHGGASGAPAGNVYFTQGNSWNNLIDVQSTMSSKKRVVPGDTAASFLLDVMRQKSLTFDHPASDALDEEDITLTKYWITRGASKD